MNTTVKYITAGLLSSIAWIAAATAQPHPDPKVESVTVNASGHLAVPPPLNQSRAKNRLSKDVWIAARTDGHSGTGTFNDPFNGYDGSDSTKLKTIIDRYSGQSGMTFHLLGDFVVDVSSTIGILVKDRTAFEFHNATITADPNSIRKKGSRVLAQRGYCVMQNQYCDSGGVTIRGKGVIDCNYNGMKGRTTNMKCAAINLHGSNNTVSGIWAKHAYGNAANNLENFTIILSSHYDNVNQRHPLDKDLLISNCKATDFLGDYGCALIITRMNSGRAEGIIRDCYVEGYRNTTSSSGSTDGSVVALSNQRGLVIDNVVRNCEIGFRIEGGSNLTVARNRILRSQWIAMDFEGIGGVEGLHNIKVCDNDIEVVDWRSFRNGWKRGVHVTALGRGADIGRGITISRNRFRVYETGHTPSPGDLTLLAITNKIESAVVTDNIFDARRKVSVVPRALAASNNRHPDGSTVTGL